MRSQPGLGFTMSISESRQPRLLGAFVQRLKKLRLPRWMRLTEESALSVRDQSAGRTTAAFPVPVGLTVWAVVDRWAVSRDCILVDRDPNCRTYERDEGYRALAGQPGTHGLLGGAGPRTVVRISASANEVFLEGWVRLPRWQQSRRRPAELHLEVSPSSGWIYTFVADYGRETLNLLLREFGQPDVVPRVYIPDYR